MENFNSEKQNILGVAKAQSNNHFIIATTTEEISKIKEDYVFYDNGIEEVIISRADIAKAIAATPNKYRVNIIDTSKGDLDILCTTCGNFLDKCDPSLRAAIIEDLMAYQTGTKEIGDIPYLLDIGAIGMDLFLFSLR